MLVSIGVLSIFDAFRKIIGLEGHRMTEWANKVKWIAKSLKRSNMGWDEIGLIDD